MAEFKSEWYKSSEINNGQQWSPYSDSLSVYDVNKMVSNLNYLKGQLENAGMEGVENVETIYNKNNPEYNQLAGIDYSGGIGSNMVNNNEVSDGKVEISHNIGLTKYKHIRFIFDFGVQRLVVETYPISYLDRSYFTGFGGGQPWELAGNVLDFVSIQIVNNSNLRLRFRRFSPSTNSISVLNSEAVLLERIEGVY